MKDFFRRYTMRGFLGGNSGGSGGNSGGSGGNSGGSGGNSGGSGGNSGGSGGSGGSSSDEEWFNDGDTHIWITLQEGRTKPMLRLCLNGTLVVDWGDGTNPDTINGSSLGRSYDKFHNYAKPGDYIITLRVTGEIAFYGNGGVLRYGSSSDNRDCSYFNSIKKIEIGNNISNIKNYSFSIHRCLSSVSIPSSVTDVGENAFSGCSSLSSVNIQQGLNTIKSSAFANCYSLSSITIPDTVTSIGSAAFNACYRLASVTIPGSVTSIGSSTFYNCECLESVVINDGITSIPSSMFNNCKGLQSLAIPASIATIDSGAFYACGSLIYLDFSKHTVVPTLSSTDAFNNTASDLQIRVPAALYDEWIAATNWSTHASKIVAV